MRRGVALLIIIAALTTSAQSAEFKEYRSLTLGMDYDEIRLSNEDEIMSVYTEIRYYFPSRRVVVPFIKSELGFSYVDELEDGDELENIFNNNYYGIGAGVRVQNLILEMVFANYRIDYEWKSGDVSENRLSLKIRYEY